MPSARSCRCRRGQTRCVIWPRLGVRSGESYAHKSAYAARGIPRCVPDSPGELFLHLLVDVSDLGLDLLRLTSSGTGTVMRATVLLNSTALFRASAHRRST